MRWRVKLLLGGFLLLGAPVRAADPVSYTVKFAPSGDAALDTLLAQNSQLTALRTKLPPAPFALIGRARADQVQFLIVLHSLGYDAGQVDISIDGLALDDPALPDALEQASRSVTVRVTPQKGALFHIGQVKLEGLPPGFAPPPLPRRGDAALAAPVLDAVPELRAALQNDGYAFAAITTPPLAVATPQGATLDVTYSVNPGPRVVIGPVSFAGLKRTDADFLRHHIALRQGQVFSASAVDAARTSLLGLGVFGSVIAEPQRAGDASAPILFRVTELKRHAVSLNAAYATDTGITLGASWEDRNVLRHAETLTLSAAANGLGGTGTTAPGYDFKGVFTRPDFLVREQELSLSAEGVKESLTAYDRSALLIGAALIRPVAVNTNFSFGTSFVSEQVTQEAVRRTYLLLQLPLALTYSSVDNLLEPTHGVNAGLSATPTEPLLGQSHPFVILQGNAAVYLPVEADGRGIVAARAMAGSVQGAGQFQLPPDQRLYAGGSGSVRGYTYQTIGPLFPDDKPEGGRSMSAVSLEFRQHVWGNFGVVPFVDAGQASAASTPFTGIWHVGVGLGARYYTSIGPIRFDLAFPVTRTAKSGGFALYAGLGEAF